MQAIPTSWANKLVHREHLKKKNNNIHIFSDGVWIFLNDCTHPNTVRGWGCKQVLSCFTGEEGSLEGLRTVATWLVGGMMVTETWVLRGLLGGLFPTRGKSCRLSGSHILVGIRQPSFLALLWGWESGLTVKAKMIRLAISHDGKLLPPTHFNLWRFQT